MFEGSLVALVTPFDAQDRVDREALERLIEFHVRSGTDGLVIAGTTGESPTLRKDEHAELIRTAAEMAAGRLPVIAGTGSNSTAQTIELSLAVADAAIDAYLMVVPYYNKPVQEGLFRHFTAIADAVDKPIMLYNVPGRTVADLMPETLARLSRHPRIFGVKDATGNIDRLKACQALVEPDFCFYSGDDFTVLDFILEGGSGVVTVSGNVAPRQMASLCEAALAGNREAASLIDATLQPLNTALFVESNPIPVKWALAEMGLIQPGIRLPLTPFAGQYHEQMRSAMRFAGIGAE
ncbi:MAG: 4-hydroxy-tetrahydrodipicolinate synthase [Woeseiaceae bacterium]|nr:4-hydroxy-tetrahydrodipicolinate synthase [Woeseiaceae bacterium]